MDLKDTQKNWDQLGAKDPLFGVLSHEGKMGGKWDEKEFFATGVAEIADLLKHAGIFGFEFPLRKALDFGCAVGRLTQALAPHFDEVTGVDIAPAMLEKAKGYNKFGDKCRYVLNENPDLKQFPDSSFDLIYTNIVLQHMAPKYALAYIAEFVRVLSPEGLLVFQLPEKAQYSTLRLTLKRLTPKPLLGLYRRIQYGPKAADAPEIEMNGVEQWKVVLAVEQAGGTVKHRENGWYWVKK